ncbi:MAG: hypothetical protein AB2693_08590 [Candidatus Thiodiazotropha sp.]
METASRCSLYIALDGDVSQVVAELPNSKRRSRGKRKVGYSDKLQILETILSEMKALKRRFSQ